MRFVLGIFLSLLLSAPLSAQQLVPIGPTGGGAFLPLTGGTLTGPLQVPAGTVSAPALAIGAANSGLYQPAANQLGITVNGALQLDYGKTNSGWTSAANFYVPAGNVFVNSTQAGPQYMLNSAGANFGNLGNIDAHTWQAGFSASLGSLGTAVIKWTDNGPVTIAPNNNVVLISTTTVASLPTCNAGNKGGLAVVTDQNTAAAYLGAVTGAGTTTQRVLCNGTAWVQD